MFADPESNIQQFGLEPGMHIADFGAGGGHYALLAAKAVAPSGTIYVCELQKFLLIRIKSDAQAEHINNIEYIWSNIEKIGGSKLGDNSMDGVIFTNVLFILEDRSIAVEEIKRILKPGGKVYLTDWTDSFSGMGPHKDHVISEDTTRELFKKHGFEVEKTFDTGVHHYGLIFKKV
jgi:ubiquinone/menaquinone biosynthesis C-methylase UbiE